MKDMKRGLGGVAILGAGLLIMAAVGQAHAQDTSPKSSAADFEPPSINLIGLGDKIRDEISRAYEAAKASPTDASKLGELGMLYTVPAPLSAAECFAEAARLAPPSFRWRYFEGLAYAAGYRRAEAARAFREAARIDPRYAAVHVHLGDALVQTDQTAAAEAYQAALKLAPKFALAHYGLGECARRKGDKDAAIKHYGEAVALAPRFAAAHGALAELFEDAGQFKQAQIHRSRQQDGTAPPPGDDPLLMELYGRAAGGTQLLELVEGLAGEGRLEQGIALLQGAIDRQPGEVTLHHAMAVLLNKAGRHLEAITHFRVVLELAPAQMETLLHLSQTMLLMHDYAGAAGLLKEVLQNEPENMHAMRLFAAALLQLRRPDDAIPIIDNMMKLRPADSESHMLMSLAALTMDRVGMAAEQYAELRKKTADPRELPQNFLAHVVKLMVDQWRPSSLKTKGHRPISLNTIDRFAEALGSIDLKQDAEPFRAISDTLTKRALLLSRQGAYSEAVLVLRAGIDDRRENSTAEVIDRLRKAIQAEPDETSYRHVLALLHVSVKDMESAGRQWRELLEAHPDHEVAAISYATELAKTGDYSQAQRVLKLARKHKADSVWLANSLAWNLAVDPAGNADAAREAVELAEWVRQKAASPEPAFLDTLATSYAAAGDFKNAVEASREAIRIAIQSGKTSSIGDYRKRLVLFEAGTPYKGDPSMDRK